MTPTPDVTAEPVPLAQLGPVEDRMLEQLIGVADRVLADACSEAELALFVTAAPNLFRELRMRRRVMSMLATAARDPENVVFLDQRRP